MTILDDDKATELIGDVKAARSAAHELVGEQIARRRQRLTSLTRKSALTRERIMCAATELMAERGSTNFQMSEVSDRCHMSKGSLYYYFSDKDELIGAIFDESVDDLVDEIEGMVARSSSAREALHTLYAEFSRRLRTGTPLALAMTYQFGNAPDLTKPSVTSNFTRATRVIAAQLERAKLEGAIRADVDCETAAVFSMGGLISTSMAMTTGWAREEADTVSASLLDMLLHGLGA